MKKLRSLYRPYLLRPIFYSTIRKGSIALALVLVWNQFWGSRSSLTVWDVSFVAAVVLLARSWIAFLKYDGWKMPEMPGKTARAMLRDNKKFHALKDMVDFVDDPTDERLEPYDIDDPYRELSEDEKDICRIFSSLASGLIFLVPSLVATLFVR